jgi:TolB-like protein
METRDNAHTRLIVAWLRLGRISRGALALALLVGLALWSRTAVSAAPTIAVMPFRDLTGAAPLIGEAISETVTIDLKQLGALRVIERRQLDKALAELKLQGRRSDLDPSSAAKLGKLLGASLIVLGGYQRASSNVRLTARFVAVETGEVIGAAKIDGPETEMLRLQDRISSELLRSAGLPDVAQQVDNRRSPQPLLNSLHTLDLYGQALVSDDDRKRRLLLAESLSADPSFRYAVADLSAIERRVSELEAAALIEKRKQHEALRAKFAAETDAEKRYSLASALLTQAMSDGHYRTLLASAKLVLENCPPTPKQWASAVDMAELVGFFIVMAYSQLHEYDAVLHHGQEFLSARPASMYFSSVKGSVDGAIRAKRAQEAGKAEAAQRVAELYSDGRWDACVVANLYYYAAQAREAQRLYQACLAQGGHERDAVQGLINASVSLGEFAVARTHLESLRAIDLAGYVELTDRNKGQLYADL